MHGPQSHAIRPNAKFGVDPLRPINVTDGALSPIVTDPNLIANTGAAWVRINFVLGPWDSVTDETLYRGRTWEEGLPPDPGWIPTQGDSRLRADQF